MFLKYKAGENIFAELIYSVPTKNNCNPIPMGFFYFIISLILNYSEKKTFANRDKD
tara:strand:+ start:718 stop:885 length:168 start_codon:yes stop_codon:yes gene_type:complete